jgi:DNA polymerase-3 subunit gamma/tau
MMATTQPEDIPQTIRSRCQHFSFHAVKFDDIVAQLTQIATQEGILADPQALALLAEAGDGSMRDALSIMDQAIASAPMVDGKAKLDGNEIRELMGTVPDAVFERILEAIGESQSAAVMEELNRLLNAGNSPSQMARQLVRYLRNCLMAKLGGEKTELLQISGDERARAVRTAALFGEEDLTRFLQVMLRTFDELNYRQEPRLHLELGLMKLVHLQRLLPLEQILSGLPGVAATRSPTPRLAQTMPVQAPRAAPLEPPKPKPVVPSPFELDRQRKQNTDEVDDKPVAPPVPAPVQPEPPPVQVVETQAAETDLDKLREAVIAALDEQGHNTAASLLNAGRWKWDDDGAIQVEVGVKKTMLGLTMNGEAWKIVRDALRQAGATQKMTVIPGEASEPSIVAPRSVSRDSIEAVALGNPLVRQAQEMFHAEVRSVLDLREKGKG